MILTPGYTPVTEVYYAKPKEFKYIERELAKIIAMIEEIFSGSNKKIDINASPELANIERAFTKYFKVKECSISFYSIGPLDFGEDPNAYAMPSSFACFHKDKNNKQLSDASKLFINVSIDIALVHSLKMTPGELMSIILHEMGHCFDASVFMLLSRISIETYKDVGNIDSAESARIKGGLGGTIANFIKGTTPFLKFYMWIDKAWSSLLAEVPFIQTCWNKISLAIHSISSMLHMIGRPFSKITPFKSLVNWLSPSNLFGYSAEKFADSFASSYGYGPDAASVFAKIEKDGRNKIFTAMKDIPVLNIGVDLLKTAGGIVGYISHPGAHPKNAARIQAQVNKLKRDLKDPSLKPEVRKMIEEDIKDIEEIIDTKLLDMKENAKKGEIASTAVNTFIIKGCDGKIDPREFIQFLHKEL